MKSSQRFVDALWRYERLEGPGHWMQLEAPDQVNALLLDFLPAPVAAHAAGSDSNSCSRRVTGHAPSDVFEITV